MVTLLLWGALLMGPLPAQAGTGATKPRVLVLPWAVRGSLPGELAGEATEGFLADARTLRGFTVLTVQETAVALPPGAPCDSPACAAEVGKAAGVDQVVLGLLEATPEGTTLKLLRVSSANGTELGRTLDRVPAGKETMLLERLPAVVGRLFGENVEDLLSSAGAPPPRSAAPAPAPVVAQPEETGGGPARLLLRVGGGTGLVFAGLAAAGTTALLAVLVGKLVYDAARDEGEGMTAPAALAVDVALLGGGLATGVMALLLAGTAAVALGASFLVP